MDRLELQKQILRYLSRMTAEDGPLESMELADEWKLNRSDVADACSRLATQGLVEKETFRSCDSNVVIHQLTARGRKFVRDEWRHHK